MTNLTGELRTAHELNEVRRALAVLVVTPHIRTYLAAHDPKALEEVDAEADVDAPNDDACPGCGCEPGDGITPGCDDPDGCGYWREAGRETL